MPDEFETKLVTKIIESIVIVYYLPEEEMDLLYSYRRLLIWILLKKYSKMQE